MSKSFVLVHGAWHGAWVWEPLAAQLEARGHRVIAVDLPSCGDDPAALGTLADDADVIAGAVRALRADGGPVCVVAHSYGGVAATQAAVDDTADHVVYLCAFMPEVGMSLVGHFPELPPYVQLDGPVVRFVAEAAHDVLYNDLDPAEAARATGRLVSHNAQAVTTPVDHASWRSVPTTYVVCTEDHTIPVEVQRMFAARAGRVLELPTSHSPMLSRPAALADLLGRVGVTASVGD